MENITDLQAGIAGEYLVCADLIMSGYTAFKTEQGCPYDIILDAKGRLIKVQVKTTRDFKYMPQRKRSIPTYIYHIGNNGKKNRRKKYDIGLVDVFALVCLKTKQIAYIPYFNTQTTMTFRVPEFRGSYHDEQAKKIKIEVINLKAKGMNCSEISKILNMKLSNVYKYTSNTSIEQKGTNSGVYFDEFTLEDCLKKI